MGRDRSGDPDEAGHAPLIPLDLVETYVASFSGNHAAAASYARIPYMVLDALRGGRPYEHSTRHGWSAGNRLRRAIKKRCKDAWREYMREENMGKRNGPIAVNLPLDSGEPVSYQILSRGSADLIIGSRPVETKTCPHCGQNKPLDAFNKNATASDGRQPWCRQCTKNNDRARRGTPVRAEEEQPLVATPIAQVHDTTIYGVDDAVPEDGVFHYLSTLESAAKSLRKEFGALRERMLTGLAMETANAMLAEQNAALQDQLNQALADQAELWTLAGTGGDAALMDENAALYTKVGEQAKQIAALRREVERLRKGED